MKSLPDLIKASLSYEMKSGGDQNVEVTASLTEACFSALAVIGFNHALLSDMFEFYSSPDSRGIFFSELVELIYDGQVRSLPPDIFKELVVYYARDSTILEDLICRLDPATLDLDLSYSLFKQHGLADAQTFVTNELFGDYITPLNDYLTAIQNKDNSQSQIEGLYAYLSYILTGRVYPTGAPMRNEEHAFKAKCSLYYYLFSGDADVNALVSDSGSEQYPSLGLAIKADPSAFYSALNEAFEDSFLNEGHFPGLVSENSSRKEIVFGSMVNRQLIVNLLIDYFSNDLKSKIFLDIFLARNYPKYPQFIILPGHILEHILDELCYCPDKRLKDECELAIRSLLSHYKVPDMESFISTLYGVGCYSILEDLFRSSQRFSKLLEVALLDYKSSPGKNTEERLLSVARECLSTTLVDAPAREREAVKELLTENFSLLISIDTERVSTMFSSAEPDIHDHILEVGDKNLKFRYLDSVFKDIEQRGLSERSLPSYEVRHAYISYLAERGELEKLESLVNNVLSQPEDIKLPSVVDALIAYSRIDILSKLLQRNNRPSEAMIYLIDHLISLNEEYWDQASALGGVDEELDRYATLCINLCNEVERSSETEIVDGEPHKPSETLWVRLIEALVDMSRVDLVNKPESEEKLEHVRVLLRKTLASLLNCPGRGMSAIQHNAAVVRIFRRILKPAGISQVQSLGSVRPIIQDLYAAYKYQDILLTVAAKLLDESAYMSLMSLVGERLRGWRVSKSGECEGCGRKVVGVGIDAEWLYEQWEAKQRSRLSQHLDDHVGSLDPTFVDATSNSDSVLVVFKCGHTYHLGCLRRLSGRRRIECIVCE
jgi:hypothetical protein